MQDRLVKEMRLAGLCSIERGNAWLEESRFFEELNEKFGVTPVEEADAHRPLLMRLNDVLCVKEKRSVSHDGCVCWKGRTLQLQSPRAGLRQVEAWEQLDGTLALLDGGGATEYRPWTAAPKERPIFKNNKPYKPGPRQQFSLNRGSLKRKSGPPLRLQKAG